MQDSPRQNCTHAELICDFDRSSVITDQYKRVCGYNIPASQHDGQDIEVVMESAKKAIDFSKSGDSMRYTNHSCRPNARLCIRQGRVEFYALRAIAIDEEITVNYGETHHEGRLACRCGAPGCVGRL